jgi:proteasome lid subunit RPN8/RPN11
MVGSPVLSFGIDVVVPRIIELGMAEAPREACGLVIPCLDEPPDEWVRPLRNRHPHPEQAYEIDPLTVKGLLEDLQRQERVWEDVLIWHTHPQGQVGPSKGDMDYRHLGLKYLVVSLPRGEAVMF